MQCGTAVTIALGWLRFRYIFLTFFPDVASLLAIGPGLPLSRSPLAVSAVSIRRIRHSPKLRQIILNVTLTVIWMALLT